MCFCVKKKEREKALEKSAEEELRSRTQRIGRSGAEADGGEQMVEGHLGAGTEGERCQASGRRGMRSRRRVRVRKGGGLGTRNAVLVPRRRTRGGKEE